MFVDGSGVSVGEAVKLSCLGCAAGSGARPYREAAGAFQNDLLSTGRGRGVCDGIVWAPPDPCVLPLHLPLTEHMAEEGGKVEGRAGTLRGGPVSIQKLPQL